MSLRRNNRRLWIAATSALLATISLASSNVNADPPLASAKVVSLMPMASDHLAPVVTALAITPSGQWLAVAGDDNTIRILQANDFKQIAVLQGHRDRIRTVEFRRDGKVLASSGNDGTLILWQVSTDFSELQRVEGLPAICSLRFSPDGMQLAAVGFGPEVMIFGGTKNRAEMICACNDLRSCAFDPKGQRVVAAGRSGHIHFFDVQSGRDLGHHDLHNSRIRQCDFSKDGRRLITVGEDGAAVMFDMERAEVIQRIDVLPCKLFTFAEISDKQIAVAGSDNRIRIIDFETGAIIKHLDGHHGSISNLVYANGTLYSGGFDATIRRWTMDLDRGERLADKDVPPAPVKDTSSR